MSPDKSSPKAGQCDARWYPDDRRGAVQQLPETAGRASAQ
jgi:hypothetical protein